MNAEQQAMLKAARALISAVETECAAQAAIVEADTRTSWSEQDAARRWQGNAESFVDQACAALAIVATQWLVDRAKEAMTV